jgi:hypothetical protein
VNPTAADPDALGYGIELEFLDEQGARQRERLLGSAGSRFEQVEPAIA